MGSKYKCFQFNEGSLFEKPVGAAYQKKIEYDFKVDNGSNAKDSSIIKIQVRKIKAVLKLDDKSFSSENEYWLFDETGVVYDYVLNYPIGKIEKDENGFLMMLENEIYIISDIIDIPKMKLY